jgi:hypothetical protein
MDPAVVAAVIAAAVSVLALAVTMAVRSHGYRATSRDTEKTLKEQREHLDLTLAEQSKHLDRTIAAENTQLDRTLRSSPGSWSGRSWSGGPGRGTNDSPSPPTSWAVIRPAAHRADGPSNHVRVWLLILTVSGRSCLA